MNTFEKLSEVDYDYDGLRFDTNASSLSIYISGDFKESSKLEIKFEPFPLHYRYSIEESRTNGALAKCSSQPLSVSGASEWLDSLDALPGIQSDHCKHYRICIGSQVMDVVSEIEPNASLVYEEFEPEDLLLSASGIY